MDTPKYIPVNCELVDHIEIHATQRKPILLQYWTIHRTALVQERIQLKSWITEQGAEYLILPDNRRIRLDYILKMDTFEVSNAHCKID